MIFTFTFIIPIFIFTLVVILPLSLGYILGFILDILFTFQFLPSFPDGCFSSSFRSVEEIIFAETTDVVVFARADLLAVGSGSEECHGRREEEGGMVRVWFGRIARLRNDPGWSVCMSATVCPQVIIAYNYRRDGDCSDWQEHSSSSFSSFSFLRPHYPPPNPLSTH